MIDAENENLLSFAEAANVIPGRPHLSQVYRWTERGLRGVKLEWLRCGGKRFTSREALTRFYQRLTIADGGEAAPIPTPKMRQKQQRAAEHELTEAGFEVGGDVLD
jgi:hypothetical protein